MTHNMRAFVELSPLISKSYRLRVIYTLYPVHKVEVLDIYIKANIRRTSWNRHVWAVGYSNSSLNLQYPALRSFTNLHNGYRYRDMGGYRLCHPIMGTRRWQAQYMHVPSYYCSWRWPSRATVDNSSCSTTSIDLNYHKSIVAGNIYR